jgi:hypothetical protein
VIGLWLFVGSFFGAFAGVLVARAVGTWVVQRTFRALNAQLKGGGTVHPDELARMASIARSTCGCSPKLVNCPTCLTGAFSDGRL